MGYAERFGAEKYDETLIEYWDGAQWSIVPSPNFPNANINLLSGVSAIAANDVWAVGIWRSDVYGSANALILHWDGTQWGIDDASSSFPGVLLNAVSSLNNDKIWAVGQTYCCTAILYKANAYTTWVQQPSPSPGDSSNQLSGVAALTASDTWAVGYYVKAGSGNLNTLALHWNGNQWSQVPSPNPDGSDKLNAVAPIASNYVWAVGASNTSPQVTSILHWNGTQWSVAASPSPGSLENVLSAITVVPGTNVCAGGDTWAGGYYKSDTNPWQTLIEGYTIIPQCQP